MIKYSKKILFIFYQLLGIVNFYSLSFIFILIKFFTNYRFSFVDYSRIGNNLNILLFLRLNNLRVESLKEYSFFFIPIFYNKTKANNAFFELLEKKINILPQSQFLNFFCKFLNPRNPSFFYNFQSMSSPTGIKYDKNSIFYQLNNFEKKNISNYNKQLIDLNDEIEQIGNEYLKSINAEKNKFICFHARDNSYLNNLDIGNQEYQSYRNTNISSFEKGLNYLVKKNYKCIRMGAIVQNKHTFNDDGIIDYATNGDRSDKLDLFLSKYCSFFLGGSNGSTIFAEFFNRPILYINCDILVQTWSNNSILTFKKYFSEKLCRNLSHREILNDLEMEARKRGFLEYLKNQRIKIVDNSSEEIYEAVKEMELRIKNKFIPNIEAKKLQDKFWKIAGKDLLKSDTFNISESFILSNKYLVN